MFCSALRFIQYSMLRGISAQWLVNTRNFFLSIEVWNKVKNDKGFMNGRKVRQYPYFVRLFHTSTPLRSVELSKE